MQKIATLFFSFSDGFLFYNNARFDTPLDALRACQEHHLKEHKATKEIKESINHNLKEFENLQRGQSIIFKRWWRDLEDEFIFNGGLYPSFTVKEYRTSI